MPLLIDLFIDLQFVIVIFQVFKLALEDVWEELLESTAWALLRTVLIVMLEVGAGHCGRYGRSAV